MAKRSDLPTHNEVEETVEEHEDRHPEDLQQNGKGFLHIRPSPLRRGTSGYP